MGQEQPLLSGLRHPTTQTGPITKRCPHCGQEIYPRISPAVIVLIKKGDSVLLVHARNFGQFQRTGSRLPGAWGNTGRMRSPRSDGRDRYPYQNLKYFGSQPWPYPSGIMVGYYAEYESGTIKLQDEELSAEHSTTATTCGNPQETKYCAKVD